MSAAPSLPDGEASSRRGLARTSGTARAAAYKRWDATDTSARTKATQAARDAAAARFLAQVDPDGALDDAERERRAKAARHQHMLRMAQLSAQARARKGGKR